MTMHYMEEPSNGERRKIYKLERTLLKDGSKGLNVADLTNQLHRANDLPHNRVLSSGLAASPLFVTILAGKSSLKRVEKIHMTDPLAGSRNVFRVLPISFVVFAGTQMGLNTSFAKTDRVYANNHRSR